MIEKLMLPTKELPHPCNLQWLKKDNEVKAPQPPLSHFPLVIITKKIHGVVLFLWILGGLVNMIVVHYTMVMPTPTPS